MKKEEQHRRTHRHTSVTISPILCDLDAAPTLFNSLADFKVKLLS